MQTVDKAMSLLGHFSSTQPEIGLSELGRLAGLDKAAARRFLVALSKHGFIEQNGDTRRYRLGSAFLHFARVREATRPLSSIVQPILNSLATEIGETAHASILSGTSLATIGVAEPQRATRAFVDPTEPLPLYATASGLACLAFSPKDFIEKYLAEVRLKHLSPFTVTSKKDLRAALAQTHAKGFGRADRSFCDDVLGTAAPFFDHEGYACGAIAVAAVLSRVNASVEKRIMRVVVEAAMTVTTGIGGTAHANLIQSLSSKSS